MNCPNIRPPYECGALLSFWFTSFDKWALAFSNKAEIPTGTSMKPNITTTNIPMKTAKDNAKSVQRSVCFPVSIKKFTKLMIVSSFKTCLKLNYVHVYLSHLLPLYKTLLLLLCTTLNLCLCFLEFFQRLLQLRTGLYSETIVKYEMS